MTQFCHPRGQIQNCACARIPIRNRLRLESEWENHIGDQFFDVCLNHLDDAEINRAPAQKQRVIHGSTFTRQIGNRLDERTSTSLLGDEEIGNLGKKPAQIGMND